MKTYVESVHAQSDHLSPTDHTSRPRRTRARRGHILRSFSRTSLKILQHLGSRRTGPHHEGVQQLVLRRRPQPAAEGRGDSELAARQPRDDPDVRRQLGQRRQPDLPRLLDARSDGPQPGDARERQDLGRGADDHLGTRLVRTVHQRTGLANGRSGLAALDEGHAVVGRDGDRRRDVVRQDARTDEVGDDGVVVGTRRSRRG